jgi:ATP-dependent RNA helicase RhlE
MSTGEKRGRLAAILSTPEASRVIVFARTKRGADRVAENLGKDGITAEAIHGNKAQNARNRALDAFRSGRVKVLVATDIAARGIDVNGISHVINYDLPDEAESYVHRIGRTARNGAGGQAITLCAPEEHDKLRAVEKLTRQQLAPGGELPRPANRSRGFKPGAGKPRFKGDGSKAGGFKHGAGQGPKSQGEKAAGAGAPGRRRRRTRRPAAA